MNDVVENNVSGFGFFGDPDWHVVVVVYVCRDRKVVVYVCRDRKVVVVVYVCRDRKVVVVVVVVSYVCHVAFVWVYILQLVVCRLIL